MGRRGRSGESPKENAPHTLPGSYTVEGSFIFGISILVIGTTLMWGFELYHSSMQAISQKTVKEINAPKRFRAIQAGKELTGL